MSFLKTTFGKAAAGTFVAGVVAVGGIGIANAAEPTAESITTVSEVTPVEAPAPIVTETEVPAPEAPAPAPAPEDPAPAPTEPAPGSDEVVLPPPPPPAPEEEPAPAPLPPIERPTEVANVPGKSAGHRAATPEQAVANNQSHKVHADKSERAAAQETKHAEKKAEKSNR